MADSPEDTNPEITSPGSDRRRDPDSKRRDRRVISRMSEPQLKVYTRLLHRISKVWIALSVIYVLVLVGMHMMHGTREGVRSLFFAVLVAIVGASVYNMGRAAKSYLENESQARLAKVIERCATMLLTFVVISAILGLAHLITLF